jgi:hypothetical protein
MPGKIGNKEVSICKKPIHIKANNIQCRDRFNELYSSKEIFNIIRREVEILVHSSTNAMW